MRQAVLKHISFETFDVHSLAKRRPAVIHKARRKLDKLLSQGELDEMRKDPTFEHDFDKLKAAFKSFTADPYLGSHALVANETSRVPVRVRLTRPAELDAQATYILVGGFGGIGRTIAQLLADKGARHIAFLSRSGATSEAAVQLLETLRSQGVTTREVPADICNEGQLQKALTIIQREMPPIKGAIQCAAVFQVSFSQSSPLLTYRRLS